MKSNEDVILNILDKNPEIDGLLTLKKETPLMIFCRRKMPRAALKILERPQDCMMENISNQGESALLWACYSGFKDVAMEILKYPDLIDLNATDEYNNMALIYCTKDGLYEVGCEILKHNEKLNLTLQNHRNETPLIRFCKHKSKLALKILNSL